MSFISRSQFCNNTFTEFFCFCFFLNNIGLFNFAFKLSDMFPYLVFVFVFLFLIHTQSLTCLFEDPHNKLRIYASLSKSYSCFSGLGGALESNPFSCPARVAEGQ